MALSSMYPNSVLRKKSSLLYNVEFPVWPDRNLSSWTGIRRGSRAD